MEKRCSLWRDVSIKQKLKEFTFRKINGSTIQVKVQYELTEATSQYQLAYTILGNGEVKVDNQFLTEGKNLPELPRLGLRLQLVKGFNMIEFYGRGPHENYWDRNSSAFVGHYKSTVKDQYVPYISPQENGYKTDVRWLILTNKNGLGLMVKGDPLFCFSALHYTIEDLSQEKRGTRHRFDLKEKDFVELLLDFKQSGVGGDNSWGARPLEKYTILPKNYSFSFTFVPVNSK